MVDAMSHNWWTLLIRGGAAIILGLALIFLRPVVTVGLLAIVFVAFGLVDGAFAIFSGIRNRSYPRWWLVVLQGIISIVAGIFVLVYPAIAISAFFYVVAIWAIMNGIIQIIRALQVRKVIDNEWMMILGGVLSIAFGVLAIIFPLETLLTLLWLFGGMLIGFGIVMIIFAFRVRGMSGAGATPVAA